jgi:hypothetical protein
MVAALRPNDFNRRVAFFRLSGADDGAGNKVGGELEEQFKTRANLAYRNGGESVLAARLENRQPAILSVRQSSLADQIDADWLCSISFKVGTELVPRMFDVKERPRLAQNNTIYQFLIMERRV